MAKQKYSANMTEKSEAPSSNKIDSTELISKEQKALQERRDASRRVQERRIRDRRLNTGGRREIDQRSEINDRRDRVLSELARPYESGMNYSEVLKIIRKLLRADYIAYYEVQWHASQLVLAGAYPEIYNKSIEHNEAKTLEIPTEKKPDFKEKGHTVLCFHRTINLKKPRRSKTWEPVYIPDLSNVEDEYKGVYRKFIRGVKCEIAIPIAQLFKGKREWIPLGVLLISSRTAHSFDDNFTLGRIRDIARSFTTAANWDFLLEVDKVWKEIFNSISTDVNCSDYNDFYDKLFAALSKNVTKAIKYASIWTVSKGSSNPVLVLQRIKDFRANKLFYPEGAFKTIDYKNKIDHCYFSAYQEMSIRYNSTDSPEQAPKKPVFKSFQAKDREFKIADKEKFLENYGINPNDKVVLIPIRSYYTSNRNNTNKPRINGLVALFVANHAQNFVIDPKHLDTFSSVFGNGIFDVLRNKRRAITKEVSRHSAVLPTSFNDFLKLCADSFRHNIHCQYVGIWLYDEISKQLILQAESSLSCNLGNNIRFDYTDKPTSNSIIEKFRTSNSADPRSYFIDIKAIRSICNELQTHKDWANWVRSNLPDGTNPNPNLPGFITPIFYENECRGIIFAVNPIRYIDSIDGLNNELPKSQNFTFSDYDAKLGDHFAETIAPYLFVNHLSVEAQLGAALQGHEITHQARAIVNRSDTTYQNWKHLTTTFPLKSINAIRDMIDEGIANKTIDSSSNSLIKSVDEIIVQYNRWDFYKTLADIKDIERWSRNILFLAQTRGVLQIQVPDETEFDDVNIYHQFIDRISSVYYEEFHRKVKHLGIVDSNRTLEVRTHHSMMLLVFWNLLSNAYHYSHECTPTTIEVKELRDGSVQIDFVNYGIPITRRQIDEGKIWQKTWRSREARLVREQGTGFGLSVVDHIVRHLGLAKIQVESKEVSKRNFFLLHFLIKNQSSLPSGNNPLPANIQFTMNEIIELNKALSIHNIENEIDTAFRLGLSHQYKEFSVQNWQHHLNTATNKTTFSVILPKNINNKDLYK